MATQSGGLGDIFDLTFEKFVTPSVVKIIYILILVFAALGWLFIVFAGITQGFASFLGALIFGTIGVLVGVLLYRIMLEMVMIVFRIGDNTERMADALENQG